VADLLTPAELMWAILYLVAISALAWARSVKAVWGAAGVLGCLTLAGAVLGPAPSMGDAMWSSVWTNRVLVVIALSISAGRIHLWIRSLKAVESAQQALWEQNEELAAREEEIARQNEELQRQTEELERQGEELRLSNEELARRERALQALLDLSRSLTGGLSQGETMDRICAALAQLVNQQTAASAIIERHGEVVKVRCHYGFGEAGPQRESWAYTQSFTRLVIERNEPAALEDTDLRPDLVIPQPKRGGAMRSALSAPLRVRGRPVGSVEVYAREKQSWSEEQFAVVESLAAQASISLESAELFGEIEHERRRFETVFKALPIGIAVADRDYREVRLNPAAAALFGVAADANLADPTFVRTWELLRGGKPVPLSDVPIRRVLRTGEVVTDEIEALFSNGRRLVFLVAATPFRDREGNVSGAVAAYTDVTSLKELQRELETRRREAEEASVRKTRFLAAVSHDVRTPANAINLMAELIKRTASNPAMAPEIPQMCSELQGSAATLIELVSDVLDVARFDSGKVELMESEFSLESTLSDEGRSLLPLAQEKGLELRIDVPTPPVWLRTDRVKLARCIANLTSNAIKFTARGSVLLGGERGEDGSVMIRVADTGIGIQPEQQARIFDEFYQLRNPERDCNKGTGLGLAICKRLVDAMGGTIAVQSEPGKGSAFTITLPASMVVPRPESGGRESGQRGLGPEHATRNAAPGQSLAGVKVLVVEDHDHTRSATAKLLEGEGAAVSQAADGRRALELIRSERPQVLLLDLMLPDVDGRQVLRELRGQRPAELRHIFVLTGDLVSVDEPELRAMGVDAVCAKPVDVPCLLGAIAARQAKAASGAP
jgi:PAS domain S-box-containing protein